MRILVVGAGATGGYFGGRLAQAGREVTFLVRSPRAQTLRQKGLSLVSPHGEVTLQPVVVTADELSGPYDVVLVAVKAFSLEAVLDDLNRAVGPETLILPVLNGMRHVDTLVGRFGENAVIGGLCRINTTIDEQGRIVQFNALQELWYGERDGSSTPRIRLVDETFRNAGFDAFLTADIVSKMWEKWTLLATMGAVVCLLRGSLGEVARAPGGIATALAILDEVLTVVVAAGHRPSEAAIEETRGRLLDTQSQQTTSMYRDLLSGSPTEADQILGDLVDRARALGVATPLVSAAYTQLAIHQARR